MQCSNIIYKICNKHYINMVMQLKNNDYNFKKKSKKSRYGFVLLSDIKIFDIYVRLIFAITQ